MLRKDIDGMLQDLCRQRGVELLEGYANTVGLDEQTIREYIKESSAGKETLRADAWQNTEYSYLW